MRGFLAGFFDAEGSVGRNLRMSQNDTSVLARIQQYGAKLGFSFQLEPYGRHCSTVRLEGPLREKFRFLSTVGPAISRKIPSWDGMSLDSDSDPVQRIENGPIQDVVDIQTSTHTFFAAGLATHNCYAADKTLAPKKRNTTRRVKLPVLK